MSEVLISDAMSLPSSRADPAPGSPELTATLLGGCRVTLAGRVVDTTSSRRTRTLLAYLLMHRRALVPRDVLTEVFWPAADPAAARNSLHVALTALRQSLRAAWPDPIVQRRDDVYLIAPEVRVQTDVDAFHQAMATARRAEQLGDAAAAAAAHSLAVQLYAGDFLPTDPYVEWALPIRDQLRSDALDAQRGLMRMLQDRGDLATAGVIARAVLAIDPADEAAHRTLMSSLATNGQRHLALAQYQRLARALWRGFGIGPSPDTTTLYERIREGRE